MAEFYNYKCEKCGWTISTAEDGHYYLMSGEYYTYLCRHCHKIYEIGKRNLIDGSGMLRMFPSCPRCGSSNFKPWNPTTGRCPECGGKLIKTNSFPILAD